MTYSSGQPSETRVQERGMSEKRVGLRGGYPWSGVEGTVNNQWWSLGSYGLGPHAALRGGPVNRIGPLQVGRSQGLHLCRGPIQASVIAKCH